MRYNITLSWKRTNKNCCAKTWKSKTPSDCLRIQNEYYHLMHRFENQYYNPGFVQIFADIFHGTRQFSIDIWSNLVLRTSPVLKYTYSTQNELGRIWIWCERCLFGEVVVLLCSLTSVSFGVENETRTKTLNFVNELGQKILLKDDC